MFRLCVFSLRNRFCVYRSIGLQALEKKYGCQNYAPLPITIQVGKGIYLWDVDGNKYFDFLSAYSAVNQGHCHPDILQEFKRQAKYLTMTSRAVYNDRLGKLLQKLHKMFNYDRALLMNTGVEAGESAIKFARRWGYEVKKVPKNKAGVLFAKGNFWGRTIAACGSSDDPMRVRNFGPFQGLEFYLIEYGSSKALEKALKANPNIVAFMVQPIQGEKGVIVPPQGYLTQCKKILQKHQALLIADEIQTGLGRTGKLLCCQHEKVRPDIVLLGKSLSGGFYPVSAVLCNNQIMELIKPGEHGSTYGGNPLGAATAMAALSVIQNEKLCDNSAKRGKQLLLALQQILGKSKIKQIRGKGLFVGVEFKKEEYAQMFSKALLQNGIIAKTTQKNTIRFAPPLIISEEELEKAMKKIKRAWKKTKQSFY